jgi:hypothetical protein
MHNQIDHILTDKNGIRVYLMSNLTEKLTVILTIT